MNLDELNDRLDNGMDVYRHYVSPNIVLRKKYVSPLREEKVPSFSLYRSNKTQKICFTDFGGERGDYWEFVKLLFGLEFIDAKKKVEEDILGGGSSIRPARVIRRNKKVYDEPDTFVEINPLIRNYNRHDLDWFRKAHITKPTLYKFHVRPASAYTIIKGDKQYTIHEKPDSPIYVIQFSSGRMKVYRPFEKIYKWTSNLVAAKDIFGLDQLPERADAIFMMAGNRDTMSFYEVMGIPTIALSSESANLPPEVYSYLTTISDKICLLYDNDKQGLRKSSELADTFGIHNFTDVLDISLANDWTQMIEEGNADAISKTIETINNNIEIIH